MKKAMEKTIKDYTIEFNKVIISFIREYIERTKAFYGITDEEIGTILGLDPISYRKIFEKDDIEISSGLISTLYIITGGRFSLQELGENFEFDKEIFQKKITEIQNEHRQEKIAKLLEILKIDSDEKLDEFISNFNEISNLIKNKEELLEWLKSE